MHKRGLSLRSVSPIFQFFSPPTSPTSTPATTRTPETTATESAEPNVTLFTHQDGKNFEVTIVRLDDAVELLDPEATSHLREEDWDSDDWDEDAEDWGPEPIPSLRLSQATGDLLEAVQARRVARRDREAEGRRVHDWDGDAEDLEEAPAPVSVQSQRLDRLDWVRRQGDADVWRTRLGED